jgi:NADH-quinone oxidoreductase subunit J
METLVFYLFGGIALLAAVSVVAQKRVFYSALSLILCLGSVAVLFLALEAPFIAAVQIIVYAGAIMVMVLFVIMMLDPFSAAAARDKRRRLTCLAAALGLVALVVMFTLMRAHDPAALPVDAGGVPLAAAPVSRLGQLLFTRFLIPFEATSILILVAIMGVVVLARKQS